VAPCSLGRCRLLICVALPTIYDMCKAVDRGMTIADVKLLEKHGGKSGDYIADKRLPALSGRCRRARCRHQGLIKSSMASTTSCVPTAINRMSFATLTYWQPAGGGPILTITSPGTGYRVTVAGSALPRDHFFA